MSTLSTSAAASCLGASSHSSGLIRKILLLTLVLVFFPLFTPKAHPDQVALAWDANTEHNLAGYNIYYGGTSRNYDHAIDVGNQTSYSLTQMPDYQQTYFAVTAYDEYGQESAFSEEVVWGPEAQETVSTPSVPEGPESGTADVSYTYTTGGSSSSLGHSVEYRFDWGDGSYSQWSSSTSASKAWSAAGTYAVMAQARSAENTSVVSQWSDSLSVVIAPDSSNQNIAPLANVSASSENAGTGQLAIKAVDGVVDGYPGDYTREWATMGEGAGAWLSLDWDGYYTVDRVVIYDRPNLDDHVLRATLTFSDGSTVQVDGIDNAGGGNEFVFAPKPLTSLEFIVDEVSSSTRNIGLAEIEVFGVPYSGEDEYYLSLVTYPSGSGLISKTPDQESYSSGSLVVLEATPAAGYEFSHWSGDVQGSENPATVTMDANKSVTANFAELVETVSTPSMPEGQVGGTVNESYTYTTGGSSSSLGNPVEYRFDWGDGSYSQWSETASASKTWSAAGTYAVRAQARSASDTSVVSDWSGSLAVVIDPLLVLHTVDTSPSGLQIVVDGQSYTAPQTFSWEPGSSHTLSTPSPQNGASGEYYVFSSWNNGGDQTQTIIASATPVTYTASFSQIFEDKTDILVIAPHPDDDLITAGGVIYSAVQTGKSVKVVYITNGDYRGIDMGYQRQGEAVAGQSWLGVDEDSLIFLGYPEGHLINLFVDNPDEFDMFTTDHGQDHTYGNRGLGRTDYHTYRWGSPAAYNKHNLVMDIQDVLQTYKPEYILTTSEYDRYPDHAVTYQLMKEAVANVNNFDPQFNPSIYKTIVHWVDTWPEPIDREAYYTELPDLYEKTGLNWADRASIDLPYYAQTAKVNAISEHSSQGGLSGPLGSYVHKDEIFWVEKLFGNQIPPVPNADFDQTVQEGEQVYLDVSKSFGNTALTYQWSQTAGISVELSDPYAASPGFTAPAGLNHDENLVFQLMVSDGVSTSISDYVHVQVKAASPYENIAQLADVSASSENIDSEQSAEKAQDGIVDGWPGDHTREWATQGEGAGAWLCMEWPDYHVSDRVVVYDRPNEDDHILGAALAFNSGVEVIELDALDVIAGKTEFKFKPVKFKNMCFIVDKVSNRTRSTGLAEIEVFGISSVTEDNSDTGPNSPEPAPGNLSVTPGDFVFEGRSGGPFRPNRMTYTLTNTGEAEISWKVSNKEPWLKVSTESGTLGAGQSLDIALSIFNRDTRSLSTGEYYDTVTFENLTDCNGNTTREITLIIN